MERGFDAVTLAEVADAAGVSVKTIFNDFRSKEELFLDREEHLHGVIPATIRDRAPEVPITGALIALCSSDRVLDGGGGWTGLFDPERRAGFRRFLTVWRESPGLQARYLSSNERLRVALAAEIARELGRSEADDEVRIFSAMLVVALHQRLSVLSEMVLAQAPPRETRQRVAIAFPDLDRPGRPPERRA